MKRRLTWKIWVALAATAIAVPLLMALRGYPLQLAAIAGAAVGLLAYSVSATTEKLWRGEGR